MISANELLAKLKNILHCEEHRYDDKAIEVLETALQEAYDAGADAGGYED